MCMVSDVIQAFLILNNKKTPNSVWNRLKWIIFYMKISHFMYNFIQIIYEQKLEVFRR